MKRIILETDWWTDCDDAAALKLLIEKHKKKEIELLGVSINTFTEYSVRSVDAVLIADGIQNMPIGINEKVVHKGEPKYQKPSSRYSDRTEYENPVKMYRRLLSESDEPVEIISIGFLNNLKWLLESKADELSPLDGTQLVKSKVKKLWIMGGKWDEDGKKEYNLSASELAVESAIFVCESWPTPIVFSGFENGINTISGKNFPKYSIIYEIFSVNGHPEGRCSWDPMVSLLAVTDDFEKAGYTPVYGKATIDKDGGSHFTEDSDGRHCYVKMNYPPEYYGELIDNIICK